jgi:hypothetical protein
VEGSCEHGNEPSGSIKCWKFLSSCTIGGFSRRAQLHEVCLFHNAVAELDNSEQLIRKNLETRGRGTN